MLGNSQSHHTTCLPFLAGTPPTTRLCGTFETPQPSPGTRRRDSVLEFGCATGVSSGRGAGGGASVVAGASCGQHTACDA